LSSTDQHRALPETVQETAGFQLFKEKSRMIGSRCQPWVLACRKSESEMKAERIKSSM